MAGSDRSRRRRGDAPSPGSDDPALYEVPRAAIDILLAHPEYRIVPPMLAAPILDEPGRGTAPVGVIGRGSVRAHLQHPIALIARKLKKTRRRVSEEFFELTGLCLREVVERLAMQRVAIALRAMVDKPGRAEKIETIGRREGYTTGSAMGRRFKERSGVTPSRYRRSWSLHRKRGGPGGSPPAERPPAPDTPD